ncbi:MAG: stage III sporulation protein AF [Bacillota bacterium]|nr:stage III sporulation protein AF [Bacillota bacterium]
MKSYILSLCAVAIFVTVCNMLLPDGQFKKYTGLICSLVISAVMLMPLSKTLRTVDIAKLFDIDTMTITKEEAQKQYTFILQDEYKKRIIEDLSAYGRVYVDVDEKMNVTNIKLYMKEYKQDVESYIRETYKPLNLEIYYE